VSDIVTELIEFAVEPPDIPGLKAQSVPKIDAPANCGDCFFMKLVASIKPAPQEGAGSPKEHAR